MNRILLALLAATGLALADTATLPPPSAPSPSIEDSLATAKVEALGKRMEHDSAAVRGSAFDGRSAGAVIAQILLGLAAIAGLGFATVFVWSRLRRNAVVGQSGVIDVLETRTLQPGRTLQLVRLHNRVVAVVTTAHGAASVAEFRDNEAAEIIAELGAGSVSAKDFGAALDTLLDRFRRPGKDSA